MHLKFIIHLNTEINSDFVKIISCYMLLLETDNYESVNIFYTLNDYDILIISNR